ncbi:MAG: Type 1 glutamine amidotransferase-like domain-containing protein [Candidatus Moraniibacteriota bacterium]
MILYLSSYRLGDSPEQLSELLGENKRVAVISNALDFSTDQDRLAKGRQREFDELSAIGLIAEEVDLRRYFGKKEELKNRLKKCGLIWVRGGNSFILRRAMHQSGLDEILREFASGDSIVYAGYSAGVSVIGPTLKGVELVDDPMIVPAGYEQEVIWDGVGLVDFSFAPHYQSKHPESEAIEKVVEFYKKNGMPFRGLKDGEVIVQTI